MSSLRIELEEFERSGPISAIALDDDGSRLALGTRQGFVIVHDARTGEQVHVFASSRETDAAEPPEQPSASPSSPAITSLRFSPDGRWLLAQRGVDPRLAEQSWWAERVGRWRPTLYDLQTGSARPLADAPWNGTDAHFNADGSLLLITTWTRILVWTAPFDMNPVTLYEGEAGSCAYRIELQSLAFVPGSDDLVVGFEGQDGSPTGWEILPDLPSLVRRAGSWSNAERWTYEEPTTPNHSCGISLPTELDAFVATRCEDGTLRLIDLSVPRFETWKLELDRRSVEARGARTESARRPAAILGCCGVARDQDLTLWADKHGVLWWWMHPRDDWKLALGSERGASHVPLPTSYGKPTSFEERSWLMLASNASATRVASPTWDRRAVELFELTPPAPSR